MTDIKEKILHMRNRSLAPKRLLQDSLTLVKPIYSPLLLLVTPGLILTLFSLVLPPVPNFIVGAIYRISIHLVVLGAAFFYAHQKLNSRKTTVAKSWQKGIRKFIKLLLSRVLLYIIIIPAYILLIFPGTYFETRLAFVTFGIVIEDHSVTNALKRSWQLVKGHFWPVFWATFVLSIILYFPLILMSIIIGTTFNVSWAAIYFKVASGIPSVLYKLISGIFIFFINPVLIVYQVLLFMSLVVLDRKNTDTA